MYRDIQKILNDAVENEDIGAHGAFWRRLSRDEFVDHPVSGCLLIHKWDGAMSNLVMILRGPTKCGPQMPAGGFPPVSEENIQTISDWIDNEAPE